MSDRDEVSLVAGDGVSCGVAGKLSAHEPPGLLHLAFSVFLYRSDNCTLLQQRAASKYHFPLYWANACCSHPHPGEEIVMSAQARVREELRIDVALEHVGHFVYRAQCPSSGLVEHEFGHVLVGTTDEDPSPDPDEVAAYRWVRPVELLSGKCTLLQAPWLIPALRIAERARSI